MAERDISRRPEIALAAQDIITEPFSLDTPLSLMPYARLQLSPGSTSILRPRFYPERATNRFEAQIDIPDTSNWATPAHSNHVPLTHEILNSAHAVGAEPMKDHNRTTSGVLRLHDVDPTRMSMFYKLLSRVATTNDLTDPMILTLHGHNTRYVWVAEETKAPGQNADMPMNTPRVSVGASV